MRPASLDPFFAPVSRLPGVGPKLAPLFDRVTGRGTEGARLIDLLMHLPVDAVERKLSASIAETPNEGIATFKGVIEAHRPAPPGRSRAPSRVVVGDETGDVTLVFFNLPQARLASQMPLGAERVISGKIELFDGVKQIVHPDRILHPAKFAEEPQIEPVYPLTEGLSSRRIQNAAKLAVERVKPLPEWLDPAFVAQRQWPISMNASRGCTRHRACGISRPMARAGRASPMTNSSRISSVCCSFGVDSPTPRGVARRAMAACAGPSSPRCPMN